MVTSRKAPSETPAIAGKDWSFAGGTTGADDSGQTGDQAPSMSRQRIWMFLQCADSRKARSISAMNALRHSDGGWR